ARPPGEPFIGTTLTNHFCVRWTGVFRLNQSGRFTFEVESDDGAVLFIDDRLIVDNGGLHRLRARQAEADLSVGEHRLRLEYVQDSGPYACRLQWWTDGAEHSVFPTLKPIRVSTATDQKGEYRFRHLPPGRYRVRAHVPGGFNYSVGAEVSRRGSETTTSQSLVTSTAPTNASIFTLAYDSRFAGVDFKTMPFKKGVWKTYAKQDGLPHEQVFRVHETKDGTMWLGTLGNGALRWDGRRFTNFGFKDGLATNDVNHIAAAADGTIWFTSPAGATRWDGKSFKTFSTNEGAAAVLSGAALTDRKGRVWLSGRGTLSRWDGTNFFNLTQADGLPDAYIYSLFEDKEGRIWVGTSGAGVLRWDGQRFETFSMSDGLADGNALAIYQDRDGIMWFGTWING